MTPWVGLGLLLNLLLMAATTLLVVSVFLFA
jgi:hypothetical protein